MSSWQTEMLGWIDRQEGRLLEIVRTWAAISSWSLDLAGLEAMHAALADAFAPLGPVDRLPGGSRTTIDDDGRETTTSLGDALHLRGGGGSSGSPRVLLAIHMDTVYPPGSEPLRVELTDDGRILRSGLVTRWQA